MAAFPPHRSQRHVTFWVCLACVAGCVNATDDVREHPRFVPDVRASIEDGTHARQDAAAEVPRVRKVASRITDEVGTALRTHTDKAKRKQLSESEGSPTNRADDTNLTRRAWPKSVVRREYRTEALQVNHVGKLVSVRSSVESKGTQSVEATSSSEVETDGNESLAQRIPVPGAIIPMKKLKKGLTIAFGGLLALVLCVVCLRPALRNSVMQWLRPRRSSPSTTTTSEPTNSKAQPPKDQGSEAQRKQDAQSAAEVTSAVASFASTTIQELKKQGKLGTVGPRTKALLQELSTLSATTYLEVNAPEKINTIVKELGLNVNVDALNKEIKEGRSQLVVMADPSSGDNESRLLRISRILRLTLKAKTRKGVRALVERTHDRDFCQLVARVSIDEADVSVALKNALSQKLGLSAAWQQRNLTVAEVKDLEVEAKGSEQYDGFWSWYLVSDVVVHIKDDGNTIDFETLGLPAGADFSTKCQKSLNTLTNREYTWSWVRPEEPGQKCVEKAVSVAADREAWQPDVKDRFLAMQSWTKQILAKWYMEGCEISPQVRSTLSMVSSQSMHEFGQKNGGSSLDLETQDSIRDARNTIDANELTSEISSSMCMLLKAPNPKEPGSLVKGQEEPAVLRGYGVVRFARVIRVRLLAKTPWGLRCLIRKQDTKQAMKKHDNFIGSKIQLDEFDLNVSVDNLLFTWLNLSPDWVETNISERKRLDPKIEVHESKSYEGLVTWYLVEEIEAHVNVEAIAAGDHVMGLPQGDDFTTVELKTRNRLAKKHDHWTWRDDGN